MSFAIYFDEDSSSSSVSRALRDRGADILTTVQAKRFGLPDDDQLKFATGQGRVIYTFNARDFCRLHAEILGAFGTHAGIIVGEHQIAIGEQIRRLSYLLETRSAIDMKDNLIFLSAVAQRRGPL